MKRYRFSSALYLEWFDDEALLLVGERDLLLTVNRAGGDLFDALAAAFADRAFTLADGANWFGEQYELGAAACLEQARKVLAFARKYQLVETVADRPVEEALA